ncbi:hypothetical protein HF086_007803, partial [Spodoptera exigua]
ALGNHEFDDGPEGLAPYLKALKAPVLAANMDVSEEPILEGLFIPHIILKRKGRKIGIIGLITPDTAKLSSPGKVKFTDPKEATKREAEILYRKGVDIIILLSHCGFESDKEIARDVVVTAGSIFELLPFNDRVEIFDIEGKYIRQALERSVIDAWAYNPFKGPWLLQVSGLRVTYNVSLPEHHRITSIEIGERKEPLDDSKLYHVTAPLYLANGGDGFTMFKEGKQNERDIGRDQKILEEYIRSHSPLNIKVDGRLIINS